MKHNTYTVNLSNNQELYFQTWQVDTTPKANICIVHGYAEHSNRYHELASYFNDNGFNVYAVDHIGHGQSGGKRGHVDDYELFMDEIELLVKQAAEGSPGLPTFIYGHSMGGNLTLNYLLRRNPEIRGAIITGSWIYLGNPPSKFMEQVLRFLVKFFPKLSIPTNLDPALISKDPEEVRKYVEDPKVFNTITLKMGLEMMEASEYLKSSQHSDIPMLVMHGADDQVCLPKGSEEFASNFEGDVEYVKWPGRYHEIHNEYNREEVYAKVANWITSKL